MPVQITDVTLRDGLQMEAYVSLASKLDLFKALLECEYDRLEVTSFVNPKWVPQFQDAKEFAKAVESIPTKTELMAFVPNVKGLERLLEFNIPWVSCFIATSETFNKKNVNQTVEETRAELKTLVETAKAQGRKSRIYISTVFGCPYEKEIEIGKTLEGLKKVAELNPDEIALSDTIGTALPEKVKEIVEKFNAYFPQKRTALHMHNTYGMALANIQAGFQAGLRSFDGSTGGIGGCPYAKGATGNVASCELKYRFSRMQECSFSLSGTKHVYSELHKSNIKTHSHIADILGKGGELYGQQ